MLDMTTAVRYGKSMYGGWYAQTCDRSAAIHTRTLKEIKEWAAENSFTLEIRWDN